MTDNNEQLASFYLEKFRQNWSYIRHVEETRFKHTQIYLLITSAIISVYSFFIQLPNEGTMEKTFENMLDYVVTRYGLAILLGTLFISVYGFLLCIFLAYQKKGYDTYRSDNFKIEKWFKRNAENNSKSVPEKKENAQKNNERIIHSPFFWWYQLIAIVNSFSCGIFFITLPNVFGHSLNSVCTIIIFLSIVTIMVVIEDVLFYFIRRVEKSNVKKAEKVKAE